MPDTMYIILGVTCTTRIEFSTTLMAYPEPFFELQYENGTKNDQMKINITRIKSIILPLESDKMVLKKITLEFII